MKKLFLLACLCFATIAQATTKDDLEKAIRTFNIPAVEQIIVSEKLTARESNRFLDLSEEMIRTRAMWLKDDDAEDITTPHEGPTTTQLLIEGVGSVGFGSFGPFVFHSDISTSGRILAAASGIAGIALLYKLNGDVKKAENLTAERNLLLRKKYDDAVTIKQLMYAADIVGA
jgi:hypothetical protein